MHGNKGVGRKKLDSGADTMLDINPFVEVDRHEVALSSENALQILRDYDIVVDGTDNFPTRYLVNDACVLLGKPNVYGSIFRFEGQATVFAYEGGPCYRCLYPEPPPPGLVPSCAEGGVLGILPGTIGLIQATETVKLILGIGEPLGGNELDSADEIIAHCKSGMRSAKAVEFLKQAGFRKVRNMKGGILAWSDKVDPTVPKY